MIKNYDDDWTVATSCQKLCKELYMHHLFWVLQRHLGVHTTIIITFFFFFRNGGKSWQSYPTQDHTLVMTWQHDSIGSDSRILTFHIVSMQNNLYPAQNNMIIIEFFYRKFGEKNENKNNPPFVSLGSYNLGLNSLALCIQTGRNIIQPTNKSSSTGAKDQWGVSLA